MHGALTKDSSPSPEIPSSVSNILSLNEMLSFLKSFFSRSIVCIVCECVSVCV